MRRAPRRPRRHRPGRRPPGPGGPTDRVQHRGGLEARPAAVLVEAVPEVGAGEPGPLVALQVADSVLGVERPERVHRVAEGALDDHVLRGDRPGRG